MYLSFTFIISVFCFIDFQSCGFALAVTSNWKAKRARKKNKYYLLWSSQKNNNNNKLTMNEEEEEKKHAASWRMSTWKLQNYASRKIIELMKIRNIPNSWCIVSNINKSIIDLIIPRSVCFVLWNSSLSNAKLSMYLWTEQ